MLREWVCRNCGARLDGIAAVGGVVECEYCHSRFSVARSENAKALEYLHTAEIALELNRFDEAYAAFAQAAKCDGRESEAQFGMALARFKVQYIKDIVRDRLQPICHDISEKVFSQCEECKRALSLASPEQRAQYEAMSSEIDHIRKEFYRLKRESAAYDCFICVKVTGEDGRKTQDSEYASELYYYLKDKGFDPFYSERVIQNKTGADYEAEILYALQSAKCMVVVCGNEDYLNTPWVKNEYTRFLNLINDERKEYDSITIAWFGSTVERLPGRKGLIQGVNLQKPDAFGKLEDFVAAHKATEAPQITRKTYGEIKYEKKTAIQSQIVKRTLETYAKTAVTVSEQAKLDIAHDMLKSGNFSAAISRCDAIIATNKSCADAYFTRFLAENDCKTPEEFVSSARRVPGFDSLEKAIATADNAQKDRYYDTLYARTLNERGLYLYSEYISLPDSKPSEIKKLTRIIFERIVNAASCGVAEAAEFDEIIKTVTDTDTFIDMNIRFGDRRFEVNGAAAAKYYKAVLEVDPANESALWHDYIIEHGLCVAVDTDGTADHIDGYGLVKLLSDENGRAEAEKKLFDYGFNRHAHTELFGICVAAMTVLAEQAASRFDFLLSLIPQEEEKLYVRCLDRITDGALSCGEYATASYYNDKLIAKDKLNHKAYFNRVYIKKGATNPFAFAKNPAALYDDPDFSTAIDLYAEGSRASGNIYIDFVNRLNAEAKRLAPEIAAFIGTYFDLSPSGVQMGATVVNAAGFVPDRNIESVVLHNPVASNLIAYDTAMRNGLYITNRNYLTARLNSLFYSCEKVDSKVYRAGNSRAEQREIKENELLEKRLAPVVAAVGKRSPEEIGASYTAVVKKTNDGKRNKAIAKWTFLALVEAIALALLVAGILFVRNAEALLREIEPIPLIVGILTPVFLITTLLVVMGVSDRQAKSFQAVRYLCAGMLVSAVTTVALLICGYVL